MSVTNIPTTETEQVLSGSGNALETTGENVAFDTISGALGAASLAFIVSRNYITQDLSENLLHSAGVASVLGVISGVASYIRHR